jgi:hypothetical protein
MNLQENINRIKQVMGLLNEQGEGTRCSFSDWQNGDGINKPKITIENSDETGVKVVYVGPETGFCIDRAEGSITDTMHQLANVAGIETSKKLKELYNSGTYVKPDLSNIIMTKKDKYFDITIPFIATTEDKALPNFGRRGSWGDKNIAKKLFNDKLLEIEGNAKFGLVEKTENPKIATGGKSSDIIEYFLAFRDLQTFPIKSSPNKNKQSVVSPIKTDSTKQIVPIVPSVGTTGTQPTGGTIQTDNTSLVNQTNNSSSTQQTNTSPQQTYNYPDMSNPFKPTNGDPWLYAYDGTKLIVKNPKGRNKEFNLLNPNYFATYPDSKLNTPEKLDNAKNEIKRLYGSQLGYK